MCSDTMYPVDTTYTLTYSCIWVHVISNVVSTSLQIVLRHCTATGNWVLFIDGRYEMHGYEPIHTPGTDKEQRVFSDQ